MRAQVLEDIQYSAYRPADQTARAAVTAESAGQTKAEIDGEGYTIRQIPPTYFIQESQRLAANAQKDLEKFRQANWEERIEGQKENVRCALVLLRHGQSFYNQGKVFTGWADPDLTNRGRDEARLAGQLLKATGVKRINTVFTSLLTRAVKTAWLALDEMEQIWTPVEHNWRLNERNYGGLQGQVKGEAANVYGLERVQKWRRGYHETPPPWTDAQRQATIDRRYAHAAADAAKRGEAFPPLSESLAECQERLLPFLSEELRPAMAAAVARATSEAEAADGDYEVPVVMVVASENVLRGLVMLLEGLTETEIP